MSLVSLVSLPTRHPPTHSETEWQPFIGRDNTPPYTIQTPDYRSSQPIQQSPLHKTPSPSQLLDLLTVNFTNRHQRRQRIPRCRSLLHLIQRRQVHIRHERTRMDRGVNCPLSQNMVSMAPLVPYRVVCSIPTFGLILVSIAMRPHRLVGRYFLPASLRRIGPSTFSS